MSILETLMSAGEGGALKQLANQFGMTSDQTTSAVATLLPALAGGLQDKLASGLPRGYLILLRADLSASSSTIPRAWLLPPRFNKANP